MQVEVNALGMKLAEQAEQREARGGLVASNSDLAILENSSASAPKSKAVISIEPSARGTAGLRPVRRLPRPPKKLQLPVSRQTWRPFRRTISSCAQLVPKRAV
jgi:hypothetical protein